MSCIKIKRNLHNTLMQPVSLSSVTNSRTLYESFQVFLHPIIYQEATRQLWPEDARSEKPIP